MWLNPNPKESFENSPGAQKLPQKRGGPKILRLQNFEKDKYSCGMVPP